MARMTYNPIDNTFEGSTDNGLNVRVAHRAVLTEVDPHYAELMVNGPGPDGRLTDAANTTFDDAVAPIYTAEYWAAKAG